MPATRDAAAPSTPGRHGRERIYRHRVAVRLTHWINVVTLLVMLMSGLQILNAHPMLYWGQYGANYDKPWLMFPNGLPGWMTLPSYQDLTTGRRWHFFFAWIFLGNGLIYLVSGFLNGHFRRDLAPTGAELAPRHILQDLFDHLRLRFPRGEAAKRYNTLQKLAYLPVIFLVLPMMLLTGLTMSPGFNAIAPWMLDLFGGRQSARSLHFICANLIVLFVVVHVTMVLLAGVWNEVRSMITGWYEIKPERQS